MTVGPKKRCCKDRRLAKGAFPGQLRCVPGYAFPLLSPAVRLGSSDQIIPAAACLARRRGAYWMKAEDFSRLERPRQPMPDFIIKALRRRGRLRAYRNRPAYQQNDSLAWINKAKRAETKDRRPAEMLEDLTRGDRYMGMPYNPK